MEVKVVEIDSTYRDRESFLNPCSFHLDINKAEKTTCLEAFDVVSDAAPILSWTGNTLDDTLANVTSTTGTVVNIFIPFVSVSFASSLFKKHNYYKGLVTNGNITIAEYEYNGFSAGLHYGKFRLVPFPALLAIGDAFTLNCAINILPINVVDNEIRLFVPSFYSNSCTIVYNESTNSFNKIVKIEDSYVTFVTKTNTWQYDHTFSLREKIPNHTSALVSNTFDTINVTSTGGGDIVYIPSISYFGKILSKTSTSYKVTPFIIVPIAPMSVVQTLEFSYDNKQSLRYLGSPNQQERTWDVSIVDVQIPNRKIKNAPSLTDYSTLYLELRDQQYSPHDVIMTNNRDINTALFRLSADTSNSTKNFFSYTTSKHYKTFRFTPNRSSFVVKILTPKGDVVEFEEKDNQWPLKPKQHLQINVSFITKMT
jgi:hypothetical protein